MLETVITFLSALFFATGALMWSMWTAKFISRMIRQRRERHVARG